MEQSIRIPHDNPVFDFEVTERNEEEQKIFIIAYSSEKVEEYQKLLEKVSLKPTVADINTFGLYRIAEKEDLIDKEVHTLILEWNPYELAFMVYHQDRPTFFRQSQSPDLLESWERSTQGEWIWKHSPEELETSLTDQLDGLERFLDFYSYSVLQGEGRVTEIILTGYYPDLSSVKESLADRFLIKVSILNLLVGMDQSFDALYGLSLKEEKHKDKKNQKDKSRGRSRKKSKKKKGERSR